MIADEDLQEEDRETKSSASVLANSIYDMRRHLEEKVKAPETSQTAEDAIQADYEFFRSEYFINEMNR
ncbi:MAG: hypothetical protein ACI9S8_001185 [Chlamydiales bacterium]